MKDKYFDRYHIEIKNALDWAVNSQKGKHAFDTVDLNDLFCGGNTKVGRLLRGLIIRTNDYRGSKNKKSKYCVNLLELQRLYEDFYGVSPQLIDRDQMLYEQTLGFLSGEEIRQAQIAHLRQAQKKLIMDLVQQTGLTPTELVQIAQSKIKLSHESVKYITE